MSDVPTHIAVIERHGTHERRAVMVPIGQSLDFDEGSATRRWLHNWLGVEWHLVEFVQIADRAHLVAAAEGMRRAEDELFHKRGIDVRQTAVSQEVSRK